LREALLYYSAASSCQTLDRHSWRRIHLCNGVLYLNGVAQNEAYGAMPAYDGDPNHVYQSYRDDFPQDLEGISAQASANHAATWAAELPSHIQDNDLAVPDGMVFGMGDNRLSSLLTAAYGVSFRLRTSSDVLSSSTGPSILLQTRSTSNRSVNA
jgi:hypothetical protein